MFFFLSDSTGCRLSQIHQSFFLIGNQKVSSSTVRGSFNTFVLNLQYFVIATKILTIRLPIVTQFDFKIMQQQFCIVATHVTCEHFDSYQHFSQYILYILCYNSSCCTKLNYPCMQLERKHWVRKATKND